MRDGLPKQPRAIESAVVNVDDTANEGTHWVAFKKRGNHVMYFDSYGDLSPPLELVRYLRRGNRRVQIDYNYTRYQGDSFRCGHLCLKFLLEDDNHEA